MTLALDDGAARAAQGASNLRDPLHPPRPRGTTAGAAAQSGRRDEPLADDIIHRGGH